MSRSFLGRKYTGVRARGHSFNSIYGASAPYVRPPASYCMHENNKERKLSVKAAEAQRGHLTCSGSHSTSGVEGRLSSLSPNLFHPYWAWLQRTVPGSGGDTAPRSECSHVCVLQTIPLTPIPLHEWRSDMPLTSVFCASVHLSSWRLWKCTPPVRPRPGAAGGGSCWDSWRNQAQANISISDMVKVRVWSKKQ